ncbi:hypothetical protein GP486_004094 [Trichoglossum hirsutum]|uniref:PNPLA domain-containing protein n=1 Tax=Trichoglossum hirsutum TaxID=265104 RepID=A0A9P8LBV1_9PEZI|nr:hypothetical protein GP486_004094 [Trichoglossum hirsutum]
MAHQRDPGSPSQHRRGRNQQCAAVRVVPGDVGDVVPNISEYGLILLILVALFGQDDAESRVHSQAQLLDTASTHAASRSDDVTDTADGEDVRDGCCECGKYSESRYWCSTCRDVYCGFCWGQVRSHRRIGSVVHEKTDIRIAEIINASLKPDRTDSEEERLHQEDEVTAWFGVIRQLEGRLVFMDFGAYGEALNTIKEASGRQLHNIYPGLVSFVGAGKSTLVKLLIELHNNHEELDFLSPVVGSLRNGHCATSEDVHLYVDPHTFGSGFPILYADCEGLDGGEIDPVAGAGRSTRTTRIPGEPQRAHHGSERPVTWADDSWLSSRQYIVTNLYPRILYTFSDVVVFVLHNGRALEEALERLIGWAAIALEKSFNQPALPHAIIALNECSVELPDEWWDVEYATQWLLGPFRAPVRQDHPRFQDYIKFWNERGKKIESVERLLLMYYSGIKVVTIPAKGRPNLVKEQITKLYGKVGEACESSREKKRSLCKLLSADELHPYLQSSFDHFATNLDEPFDFIQSSFMNSPITATFGDSIVELAAKSIVDEELKGPDIFRELGFMVASCIMLDSARNLIHGKIELCRAYFCLRLLTKVGTADDIFPRYLSHCDYAIDRFCNSKWPCEYRFRRGRCVNVRTGHVKGHQRKSGTILAGEYQSSFSANSFRRTFREMIYNNLTQLLGALSYRLTVDGSPSREKVAADIHREKILGPFYQHFGGAHLFLSHSDCLSCLMALPEHPLPCGHVLCTACVRAYGTTITGKHMLEVKGCPLEIDGKLDSPCKIVLKPACAGVRVLTLDGGGVRAIAELEILRVLEKEVGGKIPLSAFFDLIVGTNTGGLVALGLAVEDWVLRERWKRFRDFFFKVFGEKNVRKLAKIPVFSRVFGPSKYGTETLEEELKRMLPKGPLFGCAWNKEVQAKVAVTSTSVTGWSVVIPNYNRVCPDDDGS